MLKFTIFGPAGHGKSTLAGYLLWRTEPEAAEHQIAHAKRTLGASFDAAQALAYLVDLSEDERARVKERDQSTSKRLHIARAVTAVERGNMSFDIIDTPGGWKYASDQRLRGLFYADVGVFAIEALAEAPPPWARLARDDKGMTETFGALLTWAALRPNAPLIVVVTKMDRVGHQRAAFDRTRRHVKAVLGDALKPQFLPVSIDVKARIGRNLTNIDAPLADWYRGSCLADAITGLKERVDVSPPAGEGVMVVTRRGERAGKGAIYFGKVLSGSFREGQQVQILPVRIGNAENAVLTGQVRYLERSGDRSASEILDAGELGGLVISRVSSRDAILQQTSLILEDSANFDRGRYVRLKLNSDGAPSWLHIAAQIEIIWLGRFHSARIFEYKVKGADIELGLLLQKKSAFVCPRAEAGNGYAFPSVLLARSSSAMDFCEAVIRSVGEVCAVKGLAPGPARRLAKRLGRPEITDTDIPIDAADLGWLASHIGRAGEAEERAPLTVIDTSMLQEITDGK